MDVGGSFGDYELVAKLGEGGMGAVFRARHRVLGRDAAIKFLQPQLCRDPEIVERFLNEARAAANIEHPGIAHIYEVGVDEKRGAFIVMELLRGESLQHRLDVQRRLSVDVAVRLLRNTCSALRAAHDKGIVHRDLKPDNIFITPDPDVEGGERPKLLDFGIAKLSDPAAFGGEQLWKTTMPMGTPYYMSPEQCRADPTIDGRTDLYAIGCILFQCVTGRFPIEGQNYLELLEAHKTKTPPPVSSYLPTCPPDLERLIGRLLAKDPANRPSTALAVYEELGAVSLEPPAIAVAATQRPPATKLPISTSTPATAAPTPAAAAKARRTRWPLLLALIAILAGAGAAIAASLGLWSAPAPATPVDAAVAAVDAAPVERGWIRLEPARFLMGSNSDEVSRALDLCLGEAVDRSLCKQSLYSREEPTREVFVAAFELQEREVTSGELAIWLNSIEGITVSDDDIRLDSVALVGLSGDAGIAVRGGEVAAAEGRRDHAAAQVSWHAARLYCRTLGGDLPSEAQWERAARGKDRRTFPWGDDSPSCAAVVFGRAEGGRCAGQPEGIGRAGASSGDRTLEGIRGLGGNVSEWVLDEFGPYAPCGTSGCSNPLALSASPDRVAIRGGAFNDLTEGLRAASRKRAGPGELMANVGFRCAR